MELQWFPSLVTLYSWDPVSDDKYPIQDRNGAFPKENCEHDEGRKVFASQGGPIILAQVENEYGNVEWAYGVGGELYIKWAAETAINLDTSVPWVMCAQSDAPDPIINTCNGFYCDEFTPNFPSKPKMWTENYVGWFSAFGYPYPFRPVEDLAFAVAHFFEKGGTFQNYYMYFGGTNFGRTAGGPLIATSYDYDAPIDEYGFIKQPKWGHLRDLHRAIKLCEGYLLSSDPVFMKPGVNLEAHIYYKSSKKCAAFLANVDKVLDANVTFNGKIYNLPAWSVSILPDCKDVVYNTAKAPKLIEPPPEMNASYLSKLLNKKIQVQREMEMLAGSRIEECIIDCATQMRRFPDCHIPLWVDSLATRVIPAVLENYDRKREFLEHLEHMLLFGGCLYQRWCEPFGFPLCGLCSKRAFYLVPGWVYPVDDSYVED